jgi:hypothetical protein
MSVRVNINGINELDFTSGVSSATTSDGVTTLALNATYSEPLTDGNGNFIFAATPSLGGDIIVVIGIPYS